MISSILSHRLRWRRRKRRERVVETSLNVMSLVSRSSLSSSNRLFRIVVLRRKIRRSSRQHIDYSKALNCRHDDEERNFVCWKSLNSYYHCLLFCFSFTFCVRLVFILLTKLCRIAYILFWYSLIIFFRSICSFHFISKFLLSFLFFYYLFYLILFFIIYQFW